MAWKMNGPKRWDFLNFLREIILEREKEKPICSFSCMGQPPSFSGLLSFAHVSSLHRLSLFLFYSLPLILLVPHSSALFTSNRFPFLKGQKTWFTLSPASIIGADPVPPPVVVLIAWEKGEGVKCAGGRSISTESVQWCASFNTEEKFTAEQCCSEHLAAWSPSLRNSSFTEWANHIARDRSYSLAVCCQLICSAVEDCPVRRRVLYAVQNLKCSRRRKVVKSSLATGLVTSEYLLDDLIVALCKCEMVYCACPPCI